MPTLSGRVQAGQSKMFESRSPIGEVFGGGLLSPPRPGWFGLQDVDGHGSLVDRTHAGLAPVWDRPGRSAS